MTAPIPRARDVIALWLSYGNPDPDHIDDANDLLFALAAAGLTVTEHDDAYHLVRENL